MYVFPADFGSVLTSTADQVPGQEGRRGQPLHAPGMAASIPAPRAVGAYPYRRRYRGRRSFVTAHDREGQPIPEFFDPEGTFDTLSLGTQILRSVGRWERFGTVGEWHVDL